MGILSLIRSGFFQSNPIGSGFCESDPVRSRFCQSDPIRSDPGFVNGPLVSIKIELTGHLGRVLLGSTVFSWLSWLVFSCSIGKKPFSVGLVDQLFQPALSLVETVENDG